MGKRDKIFKVAIPRNRCGVALSQEWLDNMAKKGEIKNTVDKSDPKSGKFQKGNQLAKRKIGMKYNVVDSILETASNAGIQPQQKLQNMLDDHESGKRILTEDSEIKISKILTDANLQAEKLRRETVISAAQVLPDDDEAISKEILEFLGFDKDDETE